MRENTFNAPKPVMCLDTKISYPSAYRASIETGIPKNKILQICNGVIKSYHNTHWCFV